jgi:hypothetical protein
MEDAEPALTLVNRDVPGMQAFAAARLLTGEHMA